MRLTTQSSNQPNAVPSIPPRQTHVTVQEIVHPAYREPVIVERCSLLLGGTADHLLAATARSFDDGVIAVSFGIIGAVSFDAIGGGRVPHHSFCWESRWTQLTCLGAAYHGHFEALVLTTFKVEVMVVHEAVSSRSHGRR